jgi:hypothetical protein
VVDRGAGTAASEAGERISPQRIRFSLWDPLELIQASSRESSILSISWRLDREFFSCAFKVLFILESLHIGALDSSVSEYLARLTDFLRSRTYDYLVPVDNLAYELIYSDYLAIPSLTRVIGPDPASYMVAHNKFDALAVAESIGLALVKRGEAPSAPLLPCFVRPVVSCAILDDEWQRFTARKVDTIENLDAKLRDDLPRVDVMLQVLVSGASLGLNCCSIDGDVLGASLTLHLHEGTSKNSSRQVAANLTR